MSFISKILGYRDFSKKNEIIKVLSNYKFESFGDKENLENVHTLIFFKTKRQQTWLFATNENLYCVLDDISLNTFEVKWNITKQNLIDNKKVILTLNIQPNFTETSGKIDFGERHKGWLYSKSLYRTASDLKEGINGIIINAMT